MRLEKVSFAETHSFSSFFLDYIEQEDSLKPFYNRFPELPQFRAQIHEKTSFPVLHRQALVKALSSQYATIPPHEEVENNIKALASEKTFTVTTGHQLNIFTGPLYFIYKIVTVINTCRQLKQAYPEYQFVPVYWMASEDHDFAEISYFNLYGRKYTWHTEQSGAVGRFNPKGLEEVLKDLPGDTKIFRDAYLKYPTLSLSVRHYVNALFGDAGLVVLDADDHSLKELLRPVLKDDLFRRTTKTLVDATAASLEAAGYKAAVHARDINLFYLDKGIRGRIERNGDNFNVVDTDLRFSSSSIEQMIEQEPEKFSPNVLLRPIYQEIILPNLAYTGGPAEVVYWLQLKSVFDHFKVPFPMLLPRNFALVMDAPSCKKWQKTGLLLKDLFEEKNFLFNHWVVKNTTHDLSMSQPIESVLSIFESVKRRASTIDETLGPLVSAEATRVLNRLEKIESKLLRAERRRHADRLRQIETIKESLFPGGSLQERTDNFLNFYQRDPGFIRKLLDMLDPLDFQFNILQYDDKE